MKKFLRILSIFSVLFPFVATGAQAAPAYVDAITYFDGAALLAPGGYYASLESLKRQFDFVCGDTFCEGEYSNLTSLAIDCSIDQAHDAIGECAWTFAGSYTDVDAVTGHLDVKHRVVVCALPIQGTAAELASYLKAAQAGELAGQGLQETALPGSRKTLYDVIASCL